jgi:hypothetical protein
MGPRLNAIRYTLNAEVGPQLLLLRLFVASSARFAPRQVHIVIVGSSRAHGAQAPVTRRRVDAGKPGLGILRRRAIRILGAEALAGLRCIGCAHVLLR